jgi:SAM-dependent methyltransferase
MLDERRLAEAHYNADDFARIRPIEETHFWFVGRNNILAAALRTLATHGSPPQRVLEIGCGTGNTLRVMRDSFPRATLIGMDALHAGLLHAKDRTTASLVEGRIEEMPFQGRFALIGMFDVLEHIEDDVAALARVNQSLDPSGSLVLTVPAGPSLWSRFDDQSRHQRRYTEPRLRSALRAARFRVDYMTHFMSVTYPALWVSRRFERFLTAAKALMARRQRAGAACERSSAIERELRVSPAINKLLGQLLRLETPVIRRRYRLPLGASLLAIASPIGKAAGKAGKEC